MYCCIKKSIFSTLGSILYKQQAKQMTYTIACKRCTKIYSLSKNVTYEYFPWCKTASWKMRATFKKWQ